ncbi:hypothetical protein NMY22_g1284 [Coprinellus aureogranulatus]|nr:hypothetical protein NMY22_g1284 [Coprinellus aureogranulatus]
MLTAPLTFTQPYYCVYGTYDGYHSTPAALGEHFSQIPVLQGQLERFGELYAEAAIVFIQGDLAHVMEERRIRYLEKSDDAYWRWDDFKDDIRRVIVEAEKRFIPRPPRLVVMAEKEKSPLDKTKDALEKLRSEHPYVFASAGSALMISGSFVIVPALGILALNAIGFTAAGVAGGSLAAFIQSVFYRGATAGLFSILQSAGATAVLPATGAIAGGVSAVGAGIASLVYGSGGNSSDGTPSSSSTSADSPPPPYPGIGPTASGMPVEYSVYKSKRRASTSRADFS